MIGQTISQYKILEKLGEGGMGVVYKAHDVKLDRTVALKFLPDRVTMTETEKVRFVQEARAAAALNHSNICTIYNVEESGGTMFMVMEYIDGGTLRGKIPFAKADDAVVAAMQIAEALQEAHAKGIVHRDIKADNVMLTSKGQAKVMDFGLAKLKGSLKLTKTSSTVGTLGYMAPEQIQGGEVDHRSDIFSYGVLLFEMLTGKLPFRGEHEAAMVYSIVNEEPQDIAGLVPELSPIVVNLIQRCLEKDPANRYQHFDDIAADLRRSRQKTSRVMRSQSGPVQGGQAGGGVQQGSGTHPTSPQVPDSSAGMPAKNPARSRTMMLAIAAIVVVLTAVGIYLFRSPSGSGVTQGKTIAVLPFVNASGIAEDEFFTEGITEDILTQLSKISELTVLSRFTLKDYDSKGKSPKAIGEELNVSSLLVGSIRRAGDQLRISCQLINTANEAEIWAETYDRTMKDVFSIQAEIAEKIAGSLKARLSVSDKERLAGPTRTNNVAHDAFLQARYFSRQPGRENQEKAVNYLTQALQSDSTYAPAWDLLASVHISQASIGYIPSADGYQLARREVERALALDPNLADAHGTLGTIKRNYDWDWIGADEAYKRGLELEPGNAVVIGGAASLAAALGRFDEAISLQRRVIELDPLRSTRYHNLSLLYYNAGRFDEAITACRKALELEPNESGYHKTLSMLYLHQSRVDEAFAEIQMETEPVWRIFGLSMVYHAMGKKKEADAQLAEFIRKYQNEGAFQVAQIYAYRGETDKAFEWLDRAYSQRDGGLSEMKGEPFLRSIEKDPRYAPFMKKMKLPV